MSRPIGLFMLLAACACASAQVTLSTVQGGVVMPAGEFYYFGSVALGGAANIDFRLTNTGTAAVYLTSLALAGPYGQDFPVVCAVSPQLCGNQPQQQLPILINPTGTLDFTLQFEPFQLGSPSATLTINAGNALSLIVSGTGVPGLTVLLNNQPLGAGETVNFGAVQVGTSQTIKLTLANPASNVTIGVPAIPALAAGSSAWRAAPSGSRQLRPDHRRNWILFSRRSLWARKRPR